MSNNTRSDAAPRSLYSGTISRLQVWQQSPKIEVEQELESNKALECLRHDNTWHSDPTISLSEVGSQVSVKMALRHFTYYSLNFYRGS